MSTIPIRHISLDLSGRVRVAPALPATRDYEHIYRAAMSVRWDGASRTLSTLPVSGWTPLIEFQKIVDMVKSEYGDHLVVGPQTTFTNIPPELQAEMRAYAA